MKAAIFDLDGTILNSMKMWRNLSYNYLVSKGIEVPRDLIKPLRKLTFKEGCSYIKKKFGLEESAEEIREILEETLADYYSNYLNLKPYVIETLDEFKNGNIRIMIATATDEHLVRMALRRHNIEDYFEHIQTVGNTGIRKGEPGFFQKAIDRLGLDSKDIWVFEDALHCILSAKRCGLNVVGVYDEFASSEEEDIKKIADIYIEDFNQLKIDML